jgi:acyl-CoA synthetase (AMP-forming)/AMP-acid ligase II
MPDENTGERLVAFVVFKPDQFMSESEIVYELHKKLTSYKLPKQIIVMEVLPKTLVGKIDKVALVKKLGA